MGTPFFFFLFSCFCPVCVFVFRVVCVVCASRSPGHGKSSTQRGDELYIESAPLRKILKKQMLCHICQANSPKIYTDW